MAEEQFALRRVPGEAAPDGQLSYLEVEIIQKQRQLVMLIRWCLPLVLFAIVLMFETYEHVIEKGQSWLNVHFTMEIFFFGVLGPSAVYAVLTFMQRLMVAQWATQTKLDDLNRDLQQKVAERTAELEASNAELLQLDEMKSEFVALVSHELRAPLTTLQGGLELALQHPDRLSGEARHTFEVMRAESERLTRFVQRILDLSRLEAGRLPIVLGPIAIRPLLRRAVAVTFADTREVEWELPPDLPLLLCDETHLEEAIRNVLINAHKYTPGDTPVHIHIEQEDGCLKLTVTDHGPGIPASAQKHIFDRFYRGPSHGENGGWGLGLYLARRLVEAQEGRLLVRSPVWPDQARPGSAFTLVLPLDVEGELDYAGSPAD